jgi:hypothetical protein
MQLRIASTQTPTLKKLQKNPQQNKTCTNETKKKRKTTWKKIGNVGEKKMM